MRGRLGGRVARVPPRRRGRPPLDRPAVGGGAGRRRSPSSIDPGRAFGTGAHPTTRLCLELLQEVEPASLARRRLRLRRALDRRREARLRARHRGRPRRGRGRGDDARTPRPNGVERARSSTSCRPAAARGGEHRARRRRRACCRSSPVERAITSGYLDRDAPRVARLARASTAASGDGWAADLFEFRP